jgi:hypothetical protein
MNCREYERKPSWPNQMYYTDIFREGLWKTTNISAIIALSRLRCDPGPLEYEAEVTKNIAVPHSFNRLRQSDLVRVVSLSDYG